MKKLTILIVAIVFYLPVYSQLENLHILNFPAKFSNSAEPTVSDINQYPIFHDNRSVEKNWVVYSDRNNNPTFSRPGSNGIFKRTQFLQKFFVVEEDGDFIHIVEDETDPLDIKLSNNAKDYGWIHKSKVLLYKSCLKNMKKINQKGMLVNTEETIKRAKEGDESALVSFYTDPDLSNKTDVNSKLYQIYHIFKKEGNSVLLGKAYEIRGRIAENIIGWVPFDRVTTWKHRIAVEPNWDEFAFKERKEKNVKASVFLNKNDCYSFINGNNYPEPQWDADPVAKTKDGSFYQRAIGEWRRFPVLNYIDEKCYKIGLIGDIFTKTNTYSSNQGAEINEKIRNLTDKLGKKNFMFIIDGTTSMQPYFNAVSKAINESIRNIENKYGKSDNLPKFGCVVYRDFAERNRLIETYDLTSNTDGIINFLNNVKAGDINDTDAAEAVNYGLTYGLRLLPDGESNFVILVGDAGNHNRNDRSFIPDTQVRQMIEEKQCHFLAFQVANKGGNVYESFADNIENILESSANNIKSNININSSSNPSRFVESNSSSNYTYNKLTNSPIVGNVLKCKAGKSISPAILQQQITDLVGFANSMVQSIEDDIATIQSGTSYKLVLSNNSVPDEYSQYVDSYNDVMLNAINEIVQTDQQAKFISQNRFQYYTPAYAAIKKNGIENHLFKPVVMFSRKELFTLQMMFETLGNIISLPSNERRQRFYDAWLELLSSHLGESDINRLKQMSSEDISQIIYGAGGLNIASTMLKISINCTMDPSCFDERQFNWLLTSLKSRALTLSSILDNPNDPRMFRSAGITYYWLDFDILP